MVDSSIVSGFITALRNKFEMKANKKNDISGDFSDDNDSYATAKSIKAYISSVLRGKADSSHAHGNLTSDGKVGSASGKPLITGTDGVVQAGNFGSSAGTFVEGNDSRLSDARTPTAHNQESSTITDSNTYANIGNQNATQESINSAVNNKLGALASVEVFLIDTADSNGNPSTAASASTMNKLYLVKATSDKDDNYNEFITVRSGSSGSYTYAWEKIGASSIDLSGFVQSSSLKAVATSGSYDDLTNKPSYTPTVTSSTSGAYKIGSINISGSSVDIYGKDTDTHVSTSDIDSEIEAYLTAITTALNS